MKYAELKQYFELNYRHLPKTIIEKHRTIHNVEKTVKQYIIEIDAQLKKHKSKANDYSNPKALVHQLKTIYNLIHE